MTSYETGVWNLYNNSVTPSIKFFGQLGFNLSNRVTDTGVQFNTDLYRNMQKYLYREEWLDAILH